MRYEYRDYMMAVDTKLMAEIGKTHIELAWRDWRIAWQNDYPPELAAMAAIEDEEY